eukprot:TRINITY_DN8565_c0_g1_i1.p1 TRINITY_DN8565_c0_g1~~TRINITY_DN8565_c0_g1_i1.p1  ORF type:complete len:128 (+),score=24.85 TRINITY_DN8565_c0_g1_i1:133-516(+)
MEEEKVKQVQGDSRGEQGSIGNLSLLNLPLNELQQRLGASTSDQEFKKVTVGLNHPLRANIHPSLPLKNNEVFSYYRDRRAVYEAILKETGDHNKAVTYSNIWYNMKYFGVKYPKVHEDFLKKFVPS